MIYTSYFAKATKLDIPNKKLCSISRFNPKWIKDLRTLSQFSPSIELLNDYKRGIVDEVSYKERYFKELDKTMGGLDSLIDYFTQLETFSNEHEINIILCCYETSDKFCHRHLLREFLKGYITIEEV